MGIDFRNISLNLGNFAIDRKFIVAIMAVFVIGVSAYAIEEAEASHFRFTHIKWVQTTGTFEVTFTGTHAWRTCSFNTGAEPVGTIVFCGTLNFGDGSSVPYYMKVTVDNNIPNANNGFIFGAITDAAGNPIKHTYTTAGPHLAFFQSGARIGSLVNAANAGFRVEAIVDMNNGNTQSPASSLSPIVFCPLGVCQFSIPAIDGDGPGQT